jgi:hypothetical protein
LGGKLKFSRLVVAARSRVVTAKAKVVKGGGGLGSDKDVTGKCDSRATSFLLRRGYADRFIFFATDTDTDTDTDTLQYEYTLAMSSNNGSNGSGHSARVLDLQRQLRAARAAERRAINLQNTYMGEMANMNNRIIELLDQLEVHVYLSKPRLHSAVNLT